MHINLKAVISFAFVTCLITACGGGSGSSSEPQPTAPTAPSTPNISVADITVTEGDEGTTEAIFTVLLDQATTNTVTVDYETSDGTAIAGEDYVAASGTLTFNANTTSQQISVSVNGDTSFEPDEQFTVSLTNPTNSNITTASAKATINNDDLSRFESLVQLKADVLEHINSFPKRGFQMDEYLDGAHELDLDADGDLDIVLMISKDIQSVYEEMIIFRNEGGAGFLKENTGLKVWAGDVAVADFNGDGLDDMFLAAGGLDADPFPGAQDILLLQQADGTLANMTEGNIPEHTFFTHTVCAGDIDSDGDEDIYIGNIGGDEDIRTPIFYMNDGAGKFTSNTTAIPFSEFNQHTMRTWCEMADFDADGYIDLAMGVANQSWPGNEKMKHHIVLFNDGTGSFIYDIENSFLDSFLSTESAEGGLDDTAVDMRFIDLNKDGCGELTVLVSDYNDRTHLNIDENNCTQQFELINRIDVSGNEDGWQPVSIGAFDSNGNTNLNLHYRAFYQQWLGDGNNARVLDSTGLNTYNIRMITNEELKILSPFQFLGTYFEQ